MTYHVEWLINSDQGTPIEAAMEAWKTMRVTDSIANVFNVKDEHDMVVTVDLTDGTVDNPVWSPSLDAIADLAEYLHAEQWDMSEILRMIRKPTAFANEYSEMLRDRMYDAVARAEEEYEVGKEDSIQSDIQAHFLPERWDGDYAVEAQCDWDIRDWNVSELTAEAIRVQLADPVKSGSDWDWVRDDPFCPKWMKDWRGPFTIEISADGHDFEEGVRIKQECLHCGQMEMLH